MRAKCNARQAASPGRFAFLKTNHGGKFVANLNKMRRKNVFKPMIQAPTHAADQKQRSLECRRAIEPPAYLMLQGSSAPFFDFMSLLHAILPAATAVGWREYEVEKALETIVANHRPPAR